MLNACTRYPNAKAAAYTECPYSSRRHSNANTGTCPASETKADRHSNPASSPSANRAAYPTYASADGAPYAAANRAAYPTYASADGAPYAAANRAAYPTYAPADGAPYSAANRASYASAAYGAANAAAKTNLYSCTSNRSAYSWTSTANDDS